MAPPVKKKLNQDDLRKLMKERRENLQINERKINSPYAKYNNVGQLHCNVCNLHIKNENLWPSHILTKVHKQNIDIAKEKVHPLYKPDPVHTSNGKRKVETVPADVKRPCIKERNNIVEDQDSKQRVASTNSSVANHLSLLQGYSSSEDDESEGERDQVVILPSSVKNEMSTGGLPSDFFDAQPSNTSVHTTSTHTDVFTEPQPVDKQKDKSCSGNKVDSLPEGFFDDPVLDAKARNVEYKDPMEDEWEKFQKTIAEESNVSEAIMEVDEEESLVERDIDQIDQQIYMWSNVKKLQSQVEETRLTQSNKEDGKSSESDSEDIDEYEDLFNWRAKAVWKR